MIPVSLDSGHRMIADTLAAFRIGPALGRVPAHPAALTPQPPCIPAATIEPVGQACTAAPTTQVPPHHRRK